MSAALYYVHEAYSTKGPKLMGRNAAGESFLRGFLLYSQSREFWLHAPSETHAQHFATEARKFDRSHPIKLVLKENMETLSQPGVLYYPAPGIGSLAHQRSLYGDAAWSLCGITHTTSSAGAMDNIAEWLTAPLQPWDGVICTSTAVKDNVVRILQRQAEYLQGRLGITRTVLPQLPVIPLGVHAQDFAFTAEQRTAARQALQAGPDDIVVMYMGRLSFHAKAHPLAMYQALQMATQHSGKRVLLIECGWHSNEAIAKAFTDAAMLTCPSVRCVMLDGRLAGNRQTAWAAADVFCSLSDNIQETFGIVPIEAMAAGLPVVVSDWDGYKDTVRDGIDGFRVPTLMAEAGLGRDIALRHALDIDSYDMYCGLACSLVAIDVAATAAAFERLFSSAEMRQRMGAAGRERVRTLYDWRTIIPQYESLWKQLAEIRKANAPSLKRPPHPWAARLDPFHAFAGYPTRQLSPQTRLALVDADSEAALQRVARYRELAMVNFAKTILPTDAEVAQVLRAAAGEPRSASQLVEQIVNDRRAFVFRALAWLVKLHVLKVVA